MRAQVLAKYGGRCAYCGTALTLKTLQVDHIKPLLRGHRKSYEGLNDFENLNPSCRSCNYFKATYDIEEFRERIDRMIPNLQPRSTVNALLRYEKIQFVNEPVVFYFERPGVVEQNVLKIAEVAE